VKRASEKATSNRYWRRFARPPSGGKVAITGDFALTGEKVNPVIKAMQMESR